MKSVFSFALMCILFISCDKPAESDGPVNNEDKYACELPASSVNGKEAWVSGDQILIHGEYSQDQVIVTLTPSDISSDGKICYLSVNGVTPVLI